MYTAKEVSVPDKSHEKIKNALRHDKGLSVKVNLNEEGNDKLLLTSGQLMKMQRAKAMGKRSVSLQMSRKQVRSNTKVEGGFLGALMGLATKVLPTLLSGLASGLISGGVEKAISGNGLYLSRHGHGTAKVSLVEGGGLYLTPHKDEGYNGLYLKHDDQVYSGKGLLLGPNSPFKGMPLIELIL